MLKNSNKTQFVKPGVEPVATCEALKRTVDIMDSNYEAADLPQIIKDSCQYLTPIEQRKLLTLMESYVELFDGILGDFDT